MAVTVSDISVAMKETIKNVISRAPMKGLVFLLVSFFMIGSTIGITIYVLMTKAIANIGR